MTGAGETWLRATEIARRLGRPDSTIRYWRNTYREHLTERIDDAGHPVYRLAAFERIAALMAERAGPTEIRRALAEDGAERALEPQAAALLDVLTRIATAVERIADRLDRRAEDG